MSEKVKYGGAICGYGMCPYIPCNDFHNCNHAEEHLKYEKTWAEKQGGEKRK